MGRHHGHEPRRYAQEFFDREYTAREVYGRLWRYARRYRLRIVVGIVCGILTAGTLVPLYQVVQPSLTGVLSHENPQKAAESPAAAQVPEQTAKRGQGEQKAGRAHGKLARELEKASELPGWFPKAEKLAAKCGIKLQKETGEMGGALVVLALFVVPLLAFLRLGLTFLNHYCLAWAAMKVVADLRIDVLKHLQKQSLQFFGRIDVGQLMSRSTSDPQQVRQIMQHVLQELAQGPFEIIVSVGFIIWFAIANHMLPTLMMICIGFPMFIVPVVALSKRIRKWAKRALKRFSVVGSRIHEILTCVRVVKAYNTEEFENAKYRRVVHDLLKATLRAVRLGLLVGPAVETVGILLLCLFLVWCYFEHITVSSMMPMLAPLVIIYKPLKQLSKIQVQIEQGRAALARIFSIFDVEMALPEKADAVEKKSFDCGIVFDDVTFRYDATDHDAVSHASFEVPRGGFVAVVGGTGSGKSTMSGLLARFYDPSSGRVTMDGIDLRDIRTADLRCLIGAVMQETLLFNDTIEENIRYGTPGATHEEVVRAAKLANAHDFIMAHGEGYARMAGEKGFSLSGGERQRIAIARAILRNPPVLILDEATSALDTVTERLVQDAIDNLMKDRTTFAIAHRLSTVRNADLILVMNDGEIVERGTHDELYALGGTYRHLCDMQKTS